MIESFIFENPKWVYSISVAIIGVFFYYYIFAKNEKKRLNYYEGEICTRCRQGFDETELFSVWQFPAAPLRFLGWDTKEELDSLYCQRCKNIMNIFMLLSFLITLPLIFFALAFIAYLIGLIDLVDV